MLEKIMDIISKYSEVDKGQLGPEVCIRELGLNSYDFMNVIAECEQEFSITVPERDIHQLETINDIAVYISARSGKVSV